MPELASPIRYNLPALTFNPQPTHIVPFQADESGLAKARMWDTIGKTLADLPQQLSDQYYKGKANKRADEKEKQDELLTTARIKALNEKAAAKPKESLYDIINKRYGNGADVEMESLPAADASPTESSLPLLDATELAPAEPQAGLAPVATGTLSSFQPQDQSAIIQAAAKNVGDQLTGVGSMNTAVAADAPLGAAAKLAPVTLPQAAEAAGVAMPAPRATGVLSAVAPRDSVTLEPNSGAMLPTPFFDRPETNGRTATAQPAPAAAAKPKARVVKDPVTGVISLDTPDGARYEMPPGANAWKRIPGSEKDKVPALLKSELVRMGGWKDGMTAQEAQDSMEAIQIKEGMIPPHLLPTAQSLARLVVNHPTLKHYPTIREAKEAVDAGLANPEAGGFSDMALIEGFQRMVNPGATVRTQTMQNMKEAAGWLQQLDPKFQWLKATEGDKFSPQARARIKILADDIFNRATKNAKPQLEGLKKIAKSYGVKDADGFINNVLSMSPLFDAAGGEVPINSPAAKPANPQAVAPASSAPVTVTTQAQYDALPSGTIYKDSYGKTKQKK